MIRTILIPSNTDLHLLIPKEYVGKQIEILPYPKEEVTEEKVKKASSAQLRGTLNLSEEQYKNFQQHAKDTRTE